jgi:aminopeptidase N
VYYLKAMPAPAQYTAKTLTALQQTAWQGMQDNANDPDFVLRWFGLYQDVAIDQPGLDKLASLLSGATVVKGLTVGQDLRWQIISTLNRYGYAGGAALVEAELARDKSDGGQISALSATVLRPDAAIKSEWLGKIEDTKTTVPFPRLRVAMGSLYPVEQASLAEASAEQRLAKLPAIDKASGPVFMRSYGYTMIPANCTAANVARLDKAIGQYKELSASTMRALKDTHEREVRCVAIKNAMTLR